MEYSARFKDRMLGKLMGPGAVSATMLAKETGVPQPTLSRWLREATNPAGAAMKKIEPPRPRGAGGKRWTSDEKVRVVMEATAAGEAGLGALLRREGLHQAELQRFREEVLQAAREGLRAKGQRKGLTPEQKRVRELEKELRRKEKALAEAAALLVLRGKVQAFLAECEEGETNGSDE
jgi:transposase